MIPGEEICLNNVDALIELHKAFIIRTVSEFTGRYVSVENDDEYSIALGGFAEAIDRFEEEKGSFLSYAKLVMLSRLKNNLRSKVKDVKVVSLDSLMESGQDFKGEEDAIDNYSIYYDEILQFKNELTKFNLTFDKLASRCPKHKDTRQRAFSIGVNSSENREIIDNTYTKKRLPIKMVAAFNKVTEKTVKGSKYFILSIMLVFVNKYENLMRWLRKGR